MFGFGVIKCELRRKTYFPMITIVLSTNDVRGERLLLNFFSNRLYKKINQQKGILKPIDEEETQIASNASICLVSTVVFPTEGKLQSFQKDIQKGNF